MYKPTSKFIYLGAQKFRRIFNRYEDERQEIYGLASKKIKSTCVGSMILQSKFKKNSKTKKAFHKIRNTS
jgi:hypothetical protein